MSYKTTLPGTLTEQTMYFMKQTSVGRLNRNLRNLLLEHLIAQKDGYSFDLDDLLADVLNLFELLDAMEKESF